MRSATDILKVVRNGLAIYGGICLIGGITIGQIEKKWDQILDKTEDRLSLIFYGKPKERVIEVDFEEVE